MSHDELVQLCGPYALGVLDGDDQAAVRDHLPDCWTCRQRVLEFEETFAEGAKVLPPVQPSPAVKQRLMERVSGHSPALNDNPQPTRAAGIAPALVAVIALLAALLGGAVGWLLRGA